MAEILKTYKVNKYFTEPEKFHVIKDIDMSIHTSEFVSIVGKSGCGKSTLLYLLSTLDTNYEGRIEINNTVVTGLSQNELAKFRNENIGFIFQFHFLLPEFTALENICIPGWIAKKPKKALEKKAMELLDFMGLADKGSKKPNSLSGGEQQRVAVARALINDPHLIFADEPTGNLDSENAYALHELFIQLRDTMNQSFLIVTHNEDLADRCNRKLTMKDGKIIL